MSRRPLIIACLTAVLATGLGCARVSAPTPLPQPAAETPSNPSAEPTAAVGGANQFVSPLDQPEARASLKRFGQYVSPATSPVQPERFTGYHAAVDLELLPGERAEQVTVRAACDGALLVARRASGYGGVAVQACRRNGEDVTVVYGHVNLASLTVAVGDRLTAGQELGRLGRAYSSETDGERGHLHWGVHRGAAVDIRGYVSRESDLGAWADPLSWLEQS